MKFYVLDYTFTPNFTGPLIVYYFPWEVDKIEFTNSVIEKYFLSKNVFKKISFEEIL